MLGELVERIRIRWLKRTTAREMESERLRRRFRERHGVEVGLYSYGCFDPRRIPAGTEIGRYCSFAPTAQIFNADHGLGFLSLHPYLYNPACGLVERETISRRSCRVGDDVWVGHNATILASARRIGRGAVIAAGAVVTRDVEPYAIVAGVPATTRRLRFDRATIERIEASRWWELERDGLRALIRDDPDFVYRPAAVADTMREDAANAALINRMNPVREVADDGAGDRGA